MSSSKVLSGSWSTYSSLRCRQAVPKLRPSPFFPPDRATRRPSIPNGTSFRLAGAGYPTVPGIAICWMSAVDTLWV
jgi:hypothetical protein